ncbi:hypothetical protein BGY98DRAFT_976942 [Russula aff. rugulosa BPL654]|nr:hypothetical protein BGY98DRAFT_976942 [Russula aff. rugulosa BPL654]
MLPETPVPRILFSILIKIFYGTIVVEGMENIPQTGRPCIVCANHANSLTDPTYGLFNSIPRTYFLLTTLFRILVTTIPLQVCHL